MVQKKYSWFQLMWKNLYIQFFVISIALLILLFFIEVYEDWMFWAALPIPVFMIVVIVFKGFIQFWNDYKQGKSR